MDQKAPLLAHRGHRWWLTALAVAAGVGASAQTLDAELLRQQQRERALRAQLEAHPGVRRPQPSPMEDGRLPDGEAPCARIDAITLDDEGASLFPWALGVTASAGDAGVDPVVGRCIGVRGIDLVVRRVQQALLERGYVTATVSAPPQNLSNGVLRLQILPGRIKAVRLSATADTRAQIRNAAPLTSGSLLNLRDIEQALENLQRLPTVEADIQIVPSSAADALPGDSDLVVDWRQIKRWRLLLSLDDSGARDTGRYQAAATLSLDHPLALNDLAYLGVDRAVNAPAGHGTDGYTLHYELPWGRWLASFTASRHQYHQAVAGASEVYRYAGESRNIEIETSRVVYRDAAHRTTLQLAAWQRSARNFIDDAEVEVQRRRTAGWQIGAAHRAFIDGGTLDLHLRYRRGTGAADSLHAVEEAFGEGSSRMGILNADAQWALPWTLAEQRGRFALAWRAQWNRTPLVPQDRFAIGGRHTVRGFDGDTVLSADRGWLLRSDIAWAPTERSELYLAIDHGEVGGRSASMLPGRRLTGAALGWRATAGHLNWDAFVGHPLAHPSAMRVASTTAGFNLSLGF